MNVSGPVFYLNQPSAQAAIHVTPEHSAGPWDVCSQYLNYTQYAPSVRDIYLALKGKIDILVYSGKCMCGAGCVHIVIDLLMLPGEWWSDAHYAFFFHMLSSPHYLLAVGFLFSS